MRELPDVTGVPPGWISTEWQYVEGPSRESFYRMWILRPDAFPDAEDGRTGARVSIDLHRHDLERNSESLPQLIANKVESAVLSLRVLCESKGVAL